MNIQSLLSPAEEASKRNAECSNSMCGYQTPQGSTPMASYATRRFDDHHHSNYISSSYGRVNMHPPSIRPLDPVPSQTSQRPFHYHGTYPPQIIPSQMDHMDLSGYPVSPRGMAGVPSSRITGKSRQRGQKKGGGRPKWSTEDDKKLVDGRARGLKWDDISKSFTDRSAIACRLRYQNYLEGRKWTKEDNQRLALAYWRFRNFMYQGIANELGMPWERVEARLFELDLGQIAQDAGVSPQEWISDFDPEETEGMYEGEGLDGR